MCSRKASGQLAERPAGLTAHELGEAAERPAGLTAHSDLTFGCMSCSAGRVAAAAVSLACWLLPAALRPEPFGHP